MNYKMMMNENSSNSYEAKQEEDDDEEMNTNKFSKAPQPTTSRQWSTALRNPRIVRVSRSLGGKDRHSKVCTIRGLRDRRIRLSVPTAVQLYDLQDRLGLNQPSKVVDWLLEVTKSDIDNLPPLDFPHHFFHQQTLLPMPMPPHHQQPSSTLFSLGAFYDANQNLMSTKSRFWDMDSVSTSRLKGKEAENVQENQGAHKLFQDTPGFPNNALTTYSSSYNMDPSSLSLSQFGSHGNLFTNSGSAMQFSSSLSGSQLPFCPSSSATSSSLFTQHAQFMSNSSVESDPRESNHIRFLSSASQHNVMPHAFIPPLGRHPITPFSSKLLDSDNNNDMGSASRS